jgi:hypothetical protein
MAKKHEAPRLLDDKATPVPVSPSSDRAGGRLQALDAELLFFESFLRHAGGGEHRFTSKETNIELLERKVAKQVSEAAS